MKKIEIEISGAIRLKFDDKSKTFKDALENFENQTDVFGIEEFLKHIAFHVTRFGTDTCVDCVGYVGTYNNKQDIEPEEKPFCGVLVENGYDVFIFDTWGIED